MSNLHELKRILVLSMLSLKKTRHGEKGLPSSSSHLILNYFCQLGIFFQSVTFYGKLD